MEYKKINEESWPRKEIFHHFIKDVKCVIAITVDLDVTEILRTCKSRNYKFFPVMLYAVSKTVNRHDEFKTRVHEDGSLIIWDRISPSYVVFHPEDELFTKLITEYEEDINIFYQKTVGDMETHQYARGFEVVYEQKNTFDVSCLPWISYKSVNLHVHDEGTYLAPVITWGRYEEKENRQLMPISMQIHHAVADGFHIGRFFKKLQTELEQLARQMM